MLVEKGAWISSKVREIPSAPDNALHHLVQSGAVLLGNVCRVALVYTSGGCGVNHVVLSRGLVSCHVVWCLVTCYAILSRGLVSCHVVWYLVTWFGVLSRGLVSCHVVWCLVACYVILSHLQGNRHWIVC